MILLIIDYIISTFVHEERTNTMSAGEMTAALQTDENTPMTVQECLMIAALQTDENTPMTVQECLMIAMQYLKCRQFLMNVC